MNPPVYNKPPIITVTGTKGKTTTVYAVSEVLQALGRNVLRVDTTGHYINGVQKSTLKDSHYAWGLVPSVSPGRYLYEFLANPELQSDGVAVLEASLGSSSLSGMGYRSHDVGVFLNVFEDHLGSSERLQKQSDIAEAKSFAFKRMQRDGWIVFNADDPLVVSQLHVTPPTLNITLLPCGLTFEHFDLDGHLQAGGQAMTVRDGKVLLLAKDSETVLVDLADIPWTFKAQFKPSAWNILMATGAVYGMFKGVWTAAMTTAFEAVRLQPYGGRLTILKAANGATIVVDYAHEKVSLVEVGKLAKTLTGPDGKLIGILRLAVDRTETLIQETGQAVAPIYDKCIVFDKIDGHFRVPKVVRSEQFKEVVGRISQVYSDAIANAGGDVERILREDEAVARAAELAGPNDVVVYIVNDDIRQSIGFAQESFKADFV